MVRTLVLASVALLAACASQPDASPARALIAPDVALTLPTPPAYPETRTIMQTARAKYGPTEAAFEAVVSLSPEQAEIVIAILGGPRLATISWDETGVHEERTPIAPPQVPTANILADLFVALWPLEAVAAALPEGVTVAEADGVRTISQGGTAIMIVTPDSTNPARSVVRNEAFGYEVRVVSQNLE
jgi:hypothetical protein